MCSRFPELRKEKWMNHGNFALLLKKECSLALLMNHTFLLKTKRNSTSKSKMLEVSLSMVLANIFVVFAMTQLRTVFN